MSLYSGSGFRSASAKGALADMPAPQHLARVFRWAFVYLAVAALLSRLLHAAWVVLNWSAWATLQSFNPTAVLAHVVLGLVSTFVFALVLWNAGKGRSSRLLAIAFGYVFGAVVASTGYLVLPVPSEGGPETYWTILGWFDSIFGGQGCTLQWLFSFLRLGGVQLRSTHVRAMIELVQLAVTIGFFIFAFARQPPAEK